MNTDSYTSEHLRLRIKMAFDSKSTLNLKNMLWFLSLVLMVNLLVCDMVSAARIKTLQKRNSFVSIGCLGLFDNAKFNRLDKICEECYSVTRTPNVERECYLYAFLTKLRERHHVTMVIVIGHCDWSL